MIRANREGRYEVKVDYDTVAEQFIRLMKLPSEYQ